MSQVTAPPAPAEATDMDPALQSGLTSRHVRLAALPSAVPWARRVLRHMLGEWQLERMSDPALLLVSELVTNAVQASQRSACLDDSSHHMVSLTLELSDTSLLMKVWDANPGLPVLREGDVTGDRGRGLLLVDFLADAWGHHDADHGKVVWCGLRIRAAPGGCAAGLADQVSLPGAGDRLGAVDRAELGQDVADVPFHGVEGDHEVVGDAAVWLALGQQVQHLPLTRGERIHQVGRPGRS